MMLKAICALVLVSAAGLALAESGTSPAVGTAAPTFNLMSNEGKPVNLTDYRGKWVILYFYPKDFTSG